MTQQNLTILGINVKIEEPEVRGESYVAKAKVDGEIVEVEGRTLKAVEKQLEDILQKVQA